MNARLLILPFVLIGASGAAAQELPKSFVECWEKAQPYQVDLTRCAAEEAMKLEAQLTEKHSKLLSLASSKDFEEEATRRDAVANIKASQAAWKQYRDTYLEAMYPGENKQQLWGTSYSSLIGIARIKLTLREIAATDDLIAEYTPK